MLVNMAPGGDFLFYWHLVGSVPEVQVADGIRPMYSKDLPQTIVTEGLSWRHITISLDSR